MAKVNPYAREGWRIKAFTDLDNRQHIFYQDHPFDREDAWRRMQKLTGLGHVVLQVRRAGCPRYEDYLEIIDGRRIAWSQDAADLLAAEGANE